MAKFQAKSDQKQISIILNLIKFDCTILYKKYQSKKTELKEAIELYEEFMTDEINGLFQNNTNFSDIVRNHNKKFLEFCDEIAIEIDETTAKQNGHKVDEDIYAFFISLQQWLIQGPKGGQQFFFMIDIDSFNYTQKLPNALKQVNLHANIINRPLFYIEN